MSIFDRKISRDEKFSNMEFFSEEAKRNAEEHLLKPENIEPYSGELPKHSNELESRTALIVFRDKAQMELIGEIFSIRESCNGKTYITDIALLESIAKEVKAGTMSIVGNNISINPQCVATLETHPGNVLQDIEETPVDPVEQEQVLRRRSVFDKS